MVILAVTPELSVALVPGLTDDSISSECATITLRMLSILLFGPCVNGVISKALRCVIICLWTYWLSSATAVLSTEMVIVIYSKHSWCLFTPVLIPFLYTGV